MGYPKHICNDNGSNLSPVIMKEIYRTLGITMRTIPVYWARANLVERQHATILNILRKLTIEQPRFWHRFLDPLMFAIRNTPNVSGFSPHELLFGRQGRTHLTFLKELWAGQNDAPETKTVYQYVLDLQNKIADTCEFAQRALAKVRELNYHLFNKNAKPRKLNVNDRVWVLNTRNDRKFDFNWVGPATVLERRGNVVYKIKFDDGAERLYHINMLKLYIARDRPQSNDVINVADDASCETDDNEVDINAAMMGLIEVSDDESEEDSDSSNAIRLEEDINDFPVARTEQTETWQDVKVNPNLPENEKKQIWNLLEEYKDVFSDVPTITNLVMYNIKLKYDEPIRHKPYKVPIHLTEAVENELDKMPKMGWIERKLLLMSVKKKGNG